MVDRTVKVKGGDGNSLIHSGTKKAKPEKPAKGRKDNAKGNTDGKAKGKEAA